jgi:hypothetical protein
MQLKIARSQRMGGLTSSNAIFCLDARAQFTADEQSNITRYKLGGQVIYNSEASKRLLDKANMQQDGSFKGSLKSLATMALVAMRLNISINSLARGHHIQCKSLDELLGAEAALMEACESLKSYLDTAASFDGRELLFDFSTGSPQMVATAVTPQPMLVVAPKQLDAPTDWAVRADEDVHDTVRQAEPDDGEYSSYQAAYGDPQGYASTYSEQPDFKHIVDQIKIKFLAVPVPLRIIGGTILLFILILSW